MTHEQRMTGCEGGWSERCGWGSRSSQTLPAVQSALDTDLGGAEVPMPQGSCLQGQLRVLGRGTLWSCALAVLGTMLCCPRHRLGPPASALPRPPHLSHGPPRGLHLLLRPHPRVSKSTPSYKAVSSVPFPTPPGSLGWQVPLWLAGGQAVTSSRLVGWGWGWGSISPATASQPRSGGCWGLGS